VWAAARSGAAYAARTITAQRRSAQLEQAAQITARRIAVWEAYHAAFEDLENEGRLRRPVVPDHCSHNAHVYYVLLETRRDRVRFIQHLNDAGVYAVSHYVPLDSSPAGVRYGRVHGSLEVTDDVSERLLRLPLWVGLTADDVGMSRKPYGGLSIPADGQSHHQAPSGINKVAAAEADPSSL
jgi:dTDP-4-amino-4,6-dideoxygalactose transaminase